jgi:hypothetical protein
MLHDKSTIYCIATYYVILFRINPKSDRLLGSQNLAWYNYGTARWQTDSVDVRDIYYAGTRSRREIDTGGMVWQGFLFRERLVPMIGLRRDRNRTMASESVPNPLTQLPDLAPP